MLDEFQLAHHRPPQLKDAMDNGWVPLAYLWYKINTDAAVFSQTRAVGIGVLIRDHMGLVVATLT